MCACREVCHPDMRRAAHHADLLGGGGSPYSRGSDREGLCRCRPCRVPTPEPLHHYKFSSCLVDRQYLRRYSSHSDHLILTTLHQQLSFRCFACTTKGLSGLLTCCSSGAHAQDVSTLGLQLNLFNVRYPIHLDEVKFSPGILQGRNGHCSLRMRFTARDCCPMP